MLQTMKIMGKIYDNSIWLTIIQYFIPTGGTGELFKALAMVSKGIFWLTSAGIGARALVAF